LIQNGHHRTAQSLVHHNFAVFRTNVTWFTPKCSEVEWWHKKDRIWLLWL